MLRRRHPRLADRRNDGLRRLLLSGGLVSVTQLVMRALQIGGRIALPARPVSCSVRCAHESSLPSAEALVWRTTGKSA